MKTITALRLPNSLRARVARLAKQTRQAPHAWMVEALTAEVERAELRAAFIDDALQSVREVEAGGPVYDLEEHFAWRSARRKNPRARRPRPVR